MLDNDIIRYILMAISLAIFLWALARFVLDWKKDERVYEDAPARKNNSEKPLKIVDDEPKAAVVDTPPSRDPDAKDDLTKIEGIGAKIEGLLNDAGIQTFADLESQDTADIKQILEDAGKRFAMHNPDSWGEQAGLADKGDWDELEAMQDRLDGGR